MYLARFSLPGAAIVQGLVRLSTLSPTLPAGVRSPWADAAGPLGERLLAAATAGASLQVVLQPGASLDRTLAACAPEAGETALRRALGAYSRLEAVAPGSVELPLERAAFDAAAAGFPPLQACVSAPPFSAGAAWLACDFRLGPSLGSLLAEADRHGYRIGYHASFEPLTVSREQLRSARLNQLALQGVAGVPAALAAMQQEIVNRLLRAAWVCREYVGVDAGEAAEWLPQALGRLFRKRFGTLGFSPPAWVPEDLAYDDELACPACTPEVSEVEDVCATAVSDEEALALLTWGPPDALAGALVPAAPPPALTVPAGPAPAADLPVPYDGEGRYLFVSYRHTDLDAISPVLRSLEARGWKLWYDRGIPGGSEWNAVLEERLASSHALLLFLSQSAVASKYVRREILFADSIDKPIVSVQLGDVRLEHGLGLVLGHCQLLRREESDFLGRLERALAYVAAA